MINNLNKASLNENGFLIIENIYSDQEVENILIAINSIDSENQTFRKSKELFAIRQFLKEIPKAQNLIFNQKLSDTILRFVGKDYFVVKSIYFDKPQQSNWFVAYHQDLTISVDKKTNIPGYGPWTVKQNQYAVQPPLEILENIYTIRIHLDPTNENNGALKIIQGSHKKGIHRLESSVLEKETEISCNVSKGGIMMMKPLLFHSSGRTINNEKRRVIHIELCNKALCAELNWAEYLELNHPGG